MAPPGTQKRNSPRKSALAKAALRKSAAGSPVNGHKPASKAELAEALAQRPKVDFLDPFMRQAAMQAKGIGLCAFLVTLAAFQRGLKVTFHYERASFDPRFAKAKMQGHRGELFSISNGTRSHTFSRTLGDLTDPAANAIAEDKHLTKAALNRAGVRTPEGRLFDKTQTALVEKFLAQHPGKRFVAKPFNGSLGRGVTVNLTSSEVLGTIAGTSDNRIILEEQVMGLEYRATVVGGRCVAVTWRRPVCVVGDGYSSINQLIAALKEKHSQGNPHWNGLSNKQALSNFLGRHGLSFQYVLEKDRVFQFSNASAGALYVDVTNEVPVALKQTAIRASDAVGLVFCGIDLIVPEDGIPCVLELNQRAYIGSHSFPSAGDSVGQSNAVSEAIVDYYFPASIPNKTNPTLAYDFTPIRAALESAQITELSLPVIGPDWRVLRFVETGIAAKAMAKLIETAARTAGVFVMSAPAAKGGLELCLAYGPNNWRAFLNVIPAQFRARLEKLAAEVA